MTVVGCKDVVDLVQIMKEPLENGRLLERQKCYRGQIAIFCPAEVDIRSSDAAS